MKLRFNLKHKPTGFALVEVLVGLAVLGVMFVALYSGFSAGFAVVQLARENLRATQILQEKVETIRLYRWDQINAPGFIPQTFTEPFYAGAAGDAGGVLYNGTLRISEAPVTEGYRNDLKLVTLRVQWKSAGVLRTREMQTFVSRYGLQNYIY